LNKLPIDFYRRKDVLLIARELLGKVIYTNIDGLVTAGRIVETEAYAGVSDRASHAWAGKRTLRNEQMYATGGTCYVYICYGIHQMFNIVTNQAGIPDAILVRAVHPIDGINTMLTRSGKSKADYTLTRGPGNVAKALGIRKVHSGLSLSGDDIFISPDGGEVEVSQVASSSRIGVAYAGEDALLPYRFYLKGNPYVSGRPR
jgi:DNA-3-methyladenine glycosylase